MKRLVEITSTIIFWACLIYMAACFFDFTMSIDPVLPVPMHDWNILKILK